MANHQKHAIVKVDGMEIPLIGIHPKETENTCDECHNVFYFMDLLFDGKRFLCKKCSVKTGG